jgi:hypothetical protein
MSVSPSLLGTHVGRSPRVFVTYSHESEEHKSLVREFCKLLRTGAGINVHLDQWVDDCRIDWSTWAMEQIREADYILAIASPAYRVRAEGLAPPQEGRGSAFEAALLRDALTRDLAEQTKRILPVVLPGREVEEIPSFLRPHSTTHYVVHELSLDGIKELLATLSNAAKDSRPELGSFVGNPYAEMHARLQAEEHGDERSDEEAEPAKNTTVHGIANFGKYKQRGDNFYGGNTFNGKRRR